MVLNITYSTVYYLIFKKIKKEETLPQNQSHLKKKKTETITPIKQIETKDSIGPIDFDIIPDFQNTQEDEDILQILIE